MGSILAIHTENRLLYIDTQPGQNTYIESPIFVSENVLKNRNGGLSRPSEVIGHRGLPNTLSEGILPRYVMIHSRILLTCEILAFNCLRITILKKGL